MYNSMHKNKKIWIFSELCLFRILTNFSPSCLNLEKISWYQMFQILSILREAQPHGFFGKFFFSFYFCLEIWCAGISQSPTRRALSNVFCADSLWAGSNKRSSIGSDKALSLLKSFHISSSSTRSCSWCSYNSLQKYTLHMHSLTYKTHQT